MEMEVKIDKSKWPAGPWQDEPDSLAYEHAGLQCILRRNRLGTWCGYVAVPDDHSQHGRYYEDVDVRVHGGLTYSSEPNEFFTEIVPAEKLAGKWLFGFDCAHCDDLIPEMLNSQVGYMLSSQVDYMTHAIYRDVNYVRDETNSLAEQLAAMG